MSSMWMHRATVVLATATLLACGGGSATVPSPETPIPVAGPDAPSDSVMGALPPVPPADGALLINVVYPPPGAPIAVRDSNFIFGSVGSGGATLSINDAPVEVAPNGAFLAFLPVPANGIYRLDARKGGEIANAEHRVRLPGADSIAPTGATIIPTSAYPRGAMALPAGEPIEVGFRGTAGGSAWLLLPGDRRIALAEEPVSARPTSEAQNFLTESTVGAGVRPMVSRYRGVLAVEALASLDTAVALPLLGEPTRGATPQHEAAFELVVDNDTARLPLALNLAALDRTVARAGMAQAPVDAPPDWTLRGRPSTAGPFHWFFPSGTRLRITGERGDFLRVRLAPDLSAWVTKQDVRLLPPGAPLPIADIGGVRFRAAESHVDLRVPLPERLPYLVSGDARTLVLDIYGGTSETNFFQYGSLDPLLERAMWSQPSDDVYRVTIELSQPVWGYHVFHDATGALTLRIRRPPVIDEERPLAGLLIAVDAGHPPAGSMGPTGLTEAEANLPVAQKLAAMLEQAGARVLMIRKDAGPVDLGLRPRMAADSNAHVLLSIHNNAFPDGVNPWENAGTSVYYYQPHSLDLARHVQRELLAELGTRDIGVGRADLALVRPTWMPSMLSETLYMMLPQHEAALRDAATQERIAQAHVRALEAFLRGRAAAR